MFNSKQINPCVLIIPKDTSNKKSMLKVFSGVINLYSHCYLSCRNSILNFIDG